MKIPAALSIAEPSASAACALKAALSLLLAAIIVVSACNASFYADAMVGGFFAFALGSVAILHFRVRPSRADTAFVALGMVALAGIDFGLLHYPPKLMVWFSFLGLSSFLVLGLRAIWARGEERTLLLYAWIPAVLFVLSEFFASDMLAWTTAMHPKTLDLYLLSFDSSLHVQLSFLLGQIFARHFPLMFTCLIFYIGLPIPISVVYAGQLVKQREKAFPAMLAFLVTGPLGIVFYNLFPAVGPRGVFANAFPFRILPVELAHRLLLEPVAAEGARNAIPSLHMTWVLLAWWYSRGLAWWERIVALLFVAFTILATLGTGEHWFVDLVVAFPFALFIESACAYPLGWKDSRRAAALLFGLGITLSWMLGLRYATPLFWTSPIVPWSLTIATIALTIMRHQKLALAFPSRRE